MMNTTIELPTQVRLDEEGSEPGGWSQFFDGVLAWIDEDEIVTRCRAAASSS